MVPQEALGVIGAEDPRLDFGSQAKRFPEVSPQHLDIRAQILGSDGLSVLFFELCEMSAGFAQSLVLPLQFIDPRGLNSEQNQTAQEEEADRKRGNPAS